MSADLSVLQKAVKADVQARPFPHLVLEGALPEALCDELIATYPSLDRMEVDAGANNMRWSYPTAKVLGNPAIPELWREFIAYHASPAFFREIVDLFGEPLLKLHPSLYADRNALERMRPGIRFRDDFETKDILMDAQIAGNTPVTEASSVRESHVDNNDKLYSGLFYLRRDDDDSEGGDLTLSKLKWYYFGKRKLKCYKREYVKKKCEQVVATVPYRKNVLVLFLNSLASLHGVTVRRPTPHPRIFMNLIGEVSGALYRIPGRSGVGRDAY